MFPSVREHRFWVPYRAEVIANRLPDGTIEHFEKKIFISRRELYDRIEKIEKIVCDLEKYIDSK
jgi:tetrahydromethanopterin S-methyltransferase subunit B